MADDRQPWLARPTTRLSLVDGCQSSLGLHNLSRVLCSWRFLGLAVLITRGVRLRPRQTRLAQRQHPTNRWTGAAVACFLTSQVRRGFREIAPPGQLRRSGAQLKNKSQGLALC